MKPGSYVELSETGCKFWKLYDNLASRKISDPVLACMQSDDGSLKEDNALARWGPLMDNAMLTSGRVPASEQLLRKRLEKAGFVDVQSFTLKQPFGPWPKDKYDPLNAT
jgi:hypothetical protein